MLSKFFRTQGTSRLNSTSIKAMSRTRSRRRRLSFESLERREVLASFIWTAGINGDFGVASNWLNTTTNTPGVPGPSDSAEIPIGIEVSSSTNRTVNNLSGSLRITSGTFTVQNLVNNSTLFNLKVDSGATLSTTGGTTAVLGAEIAGTVNTATNANFRFQRGAINLNPGVALTGAGIYRFEGDVFGGPNVELKTNVTAPQKIVFENGLLLGSGNLTVGGDLEWRGGQMSGSGQTIVTPTGTLRMTNAAVGLNQRTLRNSGSITYATVTDSLNLSNGATIENLLGATFTMDTNFSISGNFGGVFNNAGAFVRSGGVNSAQIRVTLNNTGSIEVQTGTLSLFDGTGNGGTFLVGAGAALDLTGGSRFELSNTVTFAGAGTVVTGNGVLSVPTTGSTWSVPASLPFLWQTGSLVIPTGGQLTINGTIAFVGASDTSLRGGGRLRVNGALMHQGTGSIVLQGDFASNSIPTSILIPNTRALVLQDSGGFSGGNLGRIINQGSIIRNTGAGNAAILTQVDNSGNITVNSGSLSLRTTTSTGGSFNVTSGKLLQLIDHPAGQFLASGNLTFSGEGTIAIAAGTLQSSPSGVNIKVTNPVKFVWSGGQIFVPVGATSSIIGSMRIEGTAPVSVAGGGTLILNGTVIHAGTGNLVLNGNGANAPTTLRIPANRSYVFAGSVGIYNGSGGGGRIENLGTIRKASGTGAAEITAKLTEPVKLQVDAGVLRLGIESEPILGGTMQVASGAVLDLIASNITSTFSGTFTGTGGGQIQLNRGTVLATPDIAGVTFNFPSGLFKVLGGVINTNTSTVTLKGNTTFEGASTLFVQGIGILKLEGVFEHLSTADVSLAGNATLNIASTGTYNLRRNAAIVGGVLDVDGTLRKLGGTGLSSFNTHLTNNGTVDVRVGQVVFTGAIDEVVAGTLTGGRWNVSATGVNSASLSVNTNITKIGSAAFVSVSGTNASIPSLANLANVAGTLQLLNGSTLSTAVAMTNTGRIDVNSGSLLEVAGGFTQSSTGRLAVQIIGTNAGSVRAQGATLSGQLSINFSGPLPPIGTSITLLNNTSANPITGVFTGLAQNSLLTLNGMTWRIRYNQGPGANDVVIDRQS